MRHGQQNGHRRAWRMDGRCREWRAFQAGKTYAYQKRTATRLFPGTAGISCALRA
jgi:hypothetical protein